jgi:hypothetical protein
METNNRNILKEIGNTLIRIANSDDSYMEEFQSLRKQVEDIELLLTGRNVYELNSRLTYTDISLEYKISIQSLKKWKKQGLLIPICKGGRAFLFDRLDVEDCLRNRPRIKPNFTKKVA